MKVGSGATSLAYFGILSTTTQCVFASAMLNLKTGRGNTFFKSAKAEPKSHSSRARHFESGQRTIFQVPNGTVIPVNTVPPPGKNRARCFPGLLNTPAPSVPKNTMATNESLALWWCNQATEYGFMGFSYSLEGQTGSRMKGEFVRMRNMGARYVRLYGAHDPTNVTMNRVVEAAAHAGIGVYALVWFGFNGNDRWKTRMSNIVSVIRTNPRAAWVIRNIAVGSEPLFDQVLTANQLANQIRRLKRQLSPFGMQITLSDLAYGFRKHNNAPRVFSAVDILSLNVLPFFDATATTGNEAWRNVLTGITYMQQHGPGKITRMTQTGWPSNDSVWKANSPTAVASVESEAAYAALLDAHCRDLKKWGVGYFWQIYADYMLPGWGFLDDNGDPKWNWRPLTTC